MIVNHINDWLRKVNPDSILNKRPLAVCDDGFTISIQAGSNYMSNPRIDHWPGTNAIPAYKTVEVFINPDSLTDDGDAIIGGYGSGDGVFGFVPVSVVRDLIIKHGGLLIPDEHGFFL